MQLMCQRLAPCKTGKDSPRIASSSSPQQARQAARTSSAIATTRDIKHERFARSKSALRMAVLVVFPAATKELMENCNCFRSCEQVCKAPGSQDQEVGTRKGFMHDQRTMGVQENSMLIAEGQDMDWDAEMESLTCMKTRLAMTGHEKSRHSRAHMCNHAHWKMTKLHVAEEQRACTG